MPARAAAMRRSSAAGLPRGPPQCSGVVPRCYRAAQRASPQRLPRCRRAAPRASPRGAGCPSRPSGTFERQDPGTCCWPCPSLRDTWRRRFVVPWATNDCPPGRSRPLAASEGTAPRTGTPCSLPATPGRACLAGASASLGGNGSPSVGGRGIGPASPTPALGLLAARSRTGTIASCPFRGEVEGVGRGGRIGATKG